MSGAEVALLVVQYVLLCISVFCVTGAMFVGALIAWGYCAQKARQRKLKRATDILREMRKDGGR